MYSYCVSVFIVIVCVRLNTVESLYNGHIGAGQFVRYKEVSFIGRLVQECICNPYKVFYNVMKYI